MSKAHSALAAMGYTNLTDTSKLRPYDFTCEKHGKTFYAEVKGRQTTGTALILTRGEVEHINSHPDDCILVLAHSVTVSAKARVSGGEVKVTESWKLHPEDLRPVQYIWRVSSRFSPATKYGNPVPVQISVQVEFNVLVQNHRERKGDCVD